MPYSGSWLRAAALAGLTALGAAPALAAAPVFVTLDSHDPLYDRVIFWGTLGDRAGWRAAPPLAALLSSDDAWAEEGEGEAAAAMGAGGAGLRKEMPAQVPVRARVGAWSPARAQYSWIRDLVDRKSVV